MAVAKSVRTNSKVLIETNEFQTPITEKLKASLPDGVYADLVDFITTVRFVATLISPDRPRIKDLKRGENGRITVDITKPHVLEDMSFFIKSREHYLKYGYYTAHKFSKNPGSEYRKFWDEEERRSIDGYTNPETGEWIPGYCYFYWNFGWILKTKEKKGKKRSSEGIIRSDRVEAFPDIWEIDYLYFHYIEQGEEAGLYGALLKCRGMGASFKSAIMAIRNFFLLRKSKSYMFSYHSNYLFEDGIMNKVMDAESFMQTHTAYKKRKLKTTIEHLQTGFKDKLKNNAYSGYLSEIIPVITRDPNSARGKRGKLVVHEEGGSNKWLVDSWRITDKSLNDKGNVFGYQIAQGTGGDDNSDFRGLSQLFFRPRGYGVFAIDNVFDKNTVGTVSGFFMGEYMNRPGLYTLDGVSDVVASLIRIFTDRRMLEKELDDPSEIAKKKAESAITPLEAITNMEVSVFPQELIKDRIGEIISDWETIQSKHFVCRPIRRGNHVSLTQSAKYLNITDFPYLGKQGNRAGMVIMKHPESHLGGDIPSFRYIMGIDTIDDDNDGGGGSLFSWHLMDLWKDEIVAWYIGRNIMIEEDYEMVLAVCVLYNATAMYESNLKGMYGHFKNHHALHYLADTPTILLDKSYVTKVHSVGNKSKGIRASKTINAWGRRLQAQWQRKPHQYYENKLGVDTVEDIEWLRECGLWDSMGNYDKVSAGNMLFIYREDLLKLTESSKFDTINNSEYEHDEFFQELDIPALQGKHTEQQNDLDF